MKNQITIILFKIWPTNRFSKAKSYNFYFHKGDVTFLLVQMAYSIRFGPWKFGLYSIIMIAPILDYDIANMIWLPMCLVYTHHLNSHSCTLNNFQSSYKWRELTVNWRLQKVVFDSKNGVANRWCSTVILLHEKFLQFDWLRAVAFQLNLKYPHVKLTNLLWVVV